MGLFDDGKYWYRYEDFKTVQGFDIKLKKYPVIKHTPCGAWIKLESGEKKFVRADTRKKFACPTPEKALESFEQRKKAQARILKHQLFRAEQALKLIDSEHKPKRSLIVDTPSNFAKAINDNFLDLL